MTQDGVILNRRSTPTCQDKTRSLHLKEGRLLSHGRGLGVKSLTLDQKTVL